MATTPFNWTEYLTLATNLATNTDEASLRSAISRAYYAVFHAATLQARPNGYQDRAHGRLWKMYQADSDKNAKRLSALGNQMKRARETADYDALAARISQTVTQQLADAQKFISLLAQIPATSPQPLPANPPQRCSHCGAIQP